MSAPETITKAFLDEVEADFGKLLAGELADLPHINGYAARLHVHPTHLSNSVHEVTGQAPCDFINRRYLDEARSLLRHTQVPVADIAVRLGFADASNFAKYFKRHTGYSPSSFRTQPD